MRAKRIRYLGIVAVSSALFAGALGPARAETVRVPSSSGGSLTLYSAQGYDSTMAKALQKLTGIQVQLTDYATGNLLAKIAAERNNPQWDVIWFDGDAAMQGLDYRASCSAGPRPTPRTTMRWAAHLSLRTMASILPPSRRPARSSAILRRLS